MNHTTSATGCVSGESEEMRNKEPQAQLPSEGEQRRRVLPQPQDQFSRPAKASAFILLGQRSQRTRH